MTGATQRRWGWRRETRNAAARAGPWRNAVPGSLCRKTGTGGRRCRPGTAEGMRSCGLRFDGSNIRAGEGRSAPGGQQSQLRGRPGRLQPDVAVVKRRVRVVDMARLRRSHWRIQTVARSAAGMLAVCRRSRRGGEPRPRSGRTQRLRDIPVAYVTAQNGRRHRECVMRPGAERGRHLSAGGRTLIDAMQCRGPSSQSRQTATRSLRAAFDGAYLAIRTDRTAAALTPSKTSRRGSDAAERAVSPGRPPRAASRRSLA